MQNQVTQHGGKRNGSGRKQAPEKLERHTVTLYASHVKYLRSIDANLSRAIRKLIERAMNQRDPDAGRTLKKSFGESLLRQEKDAQRAAGKRSKSWEQVKHDDSY